MSDPRRYLDDDGSQPLARKLLRSATKDGLDEARAEELARVFAAATERTTAMAPSRGFSVAKWGLFAAVASLLVGGATIIHRNAPAPVASVDTVSVAPAAPVVNDESSPSPAEEGPTTISASALPDAPAARANEPAKAAPIVPNASNDADDLLAEARALERVRSAIAARRTDDARAGLEDYRRTFPKKLLAKEAQVLEIESLLAEGRRDEAKERAQAFLASSPNSPYATRVRSLLASRPLP
ncbi:hypothetical protein AKJ09_01916 [Labilithrix luteola]|uniref:Uncharacterized protein n=1 Tax=Labilithrix luteola TaxID=1391654 RepID=A0A0K1PP20_9BACT|nr:hypothetical protein [Labilithrix luteola]AKU95252.1 hypothetical protein AKJ09_01916 [Labilithrix luteola]